MKGALVAGVALAGANTLLAACGDDDGKESSTGSKPAAGKAKKGGVLTVGFVGGGSSETVDAQLGANHIDFARQRSLYDCLLVFNRDATKLELNLAEEIELNEALDTWRIRVKDGIEFHNGKPLTAEDVIFSLKRMADPDFVTPPQFQKIDQKSFKVLDKRTLELKLLEPDYTVYELLAYYKANIVPVGYDPKNPVGTGPFKFKSFRAGQQSVFTRFDNYWDGPANIDELVIQSFSETDALLSAYQGGQVDGLVGVPLNQTKSMESRSDTQILRSPVNTWCPIVMTVDQAPFDDERVREAMKLIANRPQLVDQALAGEGEILNDMQLHVDSFTYPDVPQREQDLDKARSLLRAAGQEGLQAELVVAPLLQFTEQMALVYAEQAKGAGCDIRVRKIDTGEFYGDGFGKRPFTTDYWSAQTYLMQSAANMYPDSVYNETHWKDDEWNSLMGEAIKTADESKRAELCLQAMQVEHERGGYIIWGATSNIDALKSKVKGVPPGKTSPYLPMDGHIYHRMWID
jgi:peptide/nickel transport system substrate-binding protein